MPIENEKNTVGEKWMLELAFDPSIGLGFPAPLSAEAYFNAGGVGRTFIKVGLADTAWKEITAGIGSYQYANSRYVDVALGSDSIGDGSFEKPWKTISYAESQITTATFANPWTIFVMGSGPYTDAGLVNMKPNINLVGDISNGIVIQSPMVINAIAGQDGTVTLTNLSVSNGLVYDGTLASTATLLLNNAFVADLNWKADSANNGHLIVSNSILSGASQVRGNSNFNGSIFYGTFTINDLSPLVSINGSNLTGLPIAMIGTSGLVLSGNTSPLSLTLTGALASFTSDSGSWPLSIVGTLASSIYASLGSHTGYTPTTGADWTGTLPLNVLEALDNLAATRSLKITALDEGVSLTTKMKSINFVGAGVVATTVGDDVTVTIAGGGGGAGPTFLKPSVNAPHDYASIPGLGSLDYSITVPSAVVGDIVMLNSVEAPYAGVIMEGFVSAASTVIIRAHNVTNVAQDMPLMQWNVVVLQYASF